MQFEQSNSTRQRGSMMLEALISIVIFAFGILGLMGLQVTAVKQSADAQYRSTASMLANKLLGLMWVEGSSIASIRDKYQRCSSTTCSGYKSWFENDVMTSLPGVVRNTLTEPEVVVADNGTVTITLYWHPPTESANQKSNSDTGLFDLINYGNATRHKHVLVGKIVKNS